jgi:hypothetical protein
VTRVALAAQKAVTTTTQTAETDTAAAHATEIGITSEIATTAEATAPDLASAVAAVDTETARDPQTDATATAIAMTGEAAGTAVVAAATEIAALEAPGTRTTIGEMAGGETTTTTTKETAGGPGGSDGGTRPEGPGPLQRYLLLTAETCRPVLTPTTPAKTNGRTCLSMLAAAADLHHQHETLTRP